MTDESVSSGHTTRARVLSLIQILLEATPPTWDQKRQRHVVYVPPNPRESVDLIKKYMEKAPFKIFGLPSKEVWPDSKLRDKVYWTYRVLRNRDRKEDGSLKFPLQNYIKTSSLETDRGLIILLDSDKPEEAIKQFENKWKIKEKSTTLRLLPQRKITLKIGLSSESSKPIHDFLKNFERISNDYFLDDFPKFEFDITQIDLYDEAREAFKLPGEYDIIMIDDPWIPEYVSGENEESESFIYPIDKTQIFNAFLEKIETQKKSPTISKIFGGVFRSAFSKVCVHEDNIWVLPVIGNIQMAIFRDDSEIAVRNLLENDSQLNQDFSYLIDREKRLVMNNEKHIRAIDSVNRKLGFPSSICCRKYSRNYDVVVFWELLRMLGYEDIMDGEAVVIDRQKAHQALELLELISAIDKDSTEISKLFRKEPQMIVTIGWPSWDSEPKTELPGFNKIALRPISKSPVMGAWVLALPEHPHNKAYREEAAQILLLLTANQGVQSILAQQGNPTVLNRLKLPPENAFWDINKTTISLAIDTSKPRPRSIYWRYIEEELSRQIGEREFKNFEDKLIFTE